MVSSSEKGGNGEVSIEEIVFSCGICQATVSEVYATKESNHGFHSGSGDEDGVVTKLWIADCSHITCGKHLEGGAAPFHPKGMQPRASCPQCIEKGDDSLKELYGIRGLEEGQYDQVIPASWTICPPIKLDGTVPGMESMRFQYMNLARYAQRITKRWKDAQHKQQAMETAYTKERKQRRQIQAEVLDLKARVEELERGEAKLKKWEARKSVINHYLGAVGEMARDIETMRSQLSQLGYEVPGRSYTFEPDEAAEPRATVGDQYGSDQPRGTFFNSSSTAVATGHDHSSSARKRKLAEYAADIAQDGRHYKTRPRGSSRDLMPPPLPKPKPPHRNAPPPVEIMERQPMRRPPSSRQSVQVYEDRSWRTQQAGIPDSRHALNEQQALPFRPSPVHTAQPSNDSRDRLAYHGASRDTVNNPRPAQSHAQLPLRLPQLQQAPFYRQSGSYNAIPQPTQEAYRRSEQRVTEYDTDYGTAAQQSEDQARQPLQPFSASYLNRRPAIPSQAGGTHRMPSPQRQRQPPAASVVSPFFKRGAISRPMTTQPPPTRGGLMEPHYTPLDQDSARGYSMAPANIGGSQALSQRPTLNALSFIERPHRSDDHQPLYQPPARRLQADDRYTIGSMIPQTPRNSQGLFQRPDRAQASAAHAPSRPQSIAHHGRISFPPSQQPMSLAASQERAMKQIRGVRGLSSQGVRPRNHDNGPLYDPSRTLYSSAGGRRSIRR